MGPAGEEGYGHSLMFPSALWTICLFIFIKLSAYKVILKAMMILQGLKQRSIFKAVLVSA